MKPTIGLPQWALESTDPYIVRLREACYLDGVGHVRDWFFEMLGAHACQDALLLESGSPAGDDCLLDRCMEAYAEHSAATRQPVPAQEEIAAAVGDWQPGPEDIVLALELRGEEELASEMETSHLFTLASLFNYRLSRQGNSRGHRVMAGAILGVIGDDRPFASKEDQKRAIDDSVALGLETIRQLAIEELGL